MASASDSRQSAIGVALCSATAGLLCMLVTELFHLGSGYLSVFTAEIVNLQYKTTPFQKGIERVVGRIGGVVFGAVAIIFFRDQLGLCLLLLVVWELAVWYVQASDHLAYAAFQAGVFTAVIVGVGISSPPAAVVVAAEQTIVQVLLGVAAAGLVNFIAGLDRSIQIDTGRQPLLPLRGDWLSRSLMLTLTSLVALAVGAYFDLPAISTLTSALILGSTPNTAALQEKTWQRAAAPVVAFAYGLPALVLLAQVPHVPLLLLFQFLASFVATYVAVTSKRFGYIGIQVGLVVPLILIGEPGDIADLRQATSRLFGVMAGFLVSFAFQMVWPMPSK